MLRQVGVVLGPLSILGLRMVHFTLPGGTVVDGNNALGFALMFLWLIGRLSNCFDYHTDLIFDNLSSFLSRIFSLS